MVLEVILNLFLAAAIATVVFLGLVDLGKKARWYQPTTERCAAVVAFAIAVYLFVPNCYMGWKLHGLRAEFEAVAASGGSRGAYHRSDWERGSYELDFGGKLDRIVDKRNRMLHEHGFVGIGRWWVSDNGVVLAMFYLWIPGSAQQPGP